MLVNSQYRLARAAFLAILVAITTAAAPRAFAAPERISAALPLRIRLTDGRSFAANRLRLGWNDLLQIEGPSGQSTHVPTVKIAEVKDGEGHDLTRLVLDGHEVVGVTPGSASADSAESVPLSDFMSDQQVQASRRPPLSGFLIQGAYLIRVGETKESIDTGYGSDVIQRGLFQTEVGGMGRVGKKMGWGCSVLLGGNGDLTVLGAKARIRRLLGSRTYVDFAPGYLSQIPTNGDLPESHGFVGEVTLMADGWVGITTQFQSVEMENTNGSSSREWWWYAGPKIGGTPGIAAAVIALLLTAGSQITD